MSGLVDLGEHGRSDTWWTPVRVVLAIAGVMFILSLVAKAPCAAGAWWDEPQDYANACHTDLASEYATTGLAEGLPPWDVNPRGHLLPEDRSVPDALLSYGSASVAQALTGATGLAERSNEPVDSLQADSTVQHEATVALAVSAVVQLLAFLTGVLLLVRSARHPYDLTVLAGAPVIVFTALLGWDMILFALVCAAWWAWRRRRPTLCGAFIGIACVMAAWPLLILPAIAFATLRRGDGDQVGRAFGGAVIAWVCCVIPMVAITGGMLFDSIGEYAGLSAGPGSVWDVLADVGIKPDSGTINLILLIGMTVLLMGAAVFALKARRPPDAATVAFLLVLGWFAITKTYQPQYALALLPLAALAWPRWRDLLVWQAGQILFVFATWWHLGGFTWDSGDVDRVYPAVTVIRIGIDLWLITRIVARPGWMKSLPGFRWSQGAYTNEKPANSPRAVSPTAPDRTS